MTLVTKQTRLIHPESGDYPVYLDQMGSRLVGSFPSTVDSEIMETFGYFAVTMTPMPQGDVVIEGVPEEIDGAWFSTWVVREYTPEEKASLLQQAKDNALYQIERLRIDEFEKGVPYEFEGNTYMIQVRNTDRINILARYIKAKEALAEGTPFSIGFRTAEDVSIQLDAAGMVAMADEIESKVDLGYKTIWDLKDLTKLAETISEIPEIPATIFSV